MSHGHKRKIAVAVTHRTPYGRLKPIMRAIAAHPDLELQVIVATPLSFHNVLSAIRHGDIPSLRKSLPWFVRARIRTLWGGAAEVSKVDLLSRLVIADGFTIAAHVPLFVEGRNLKSMAKSVGVGLLELPEVLQKLASDILLIHADRFEMLSFAIAGSLMNIPIAHTQGGDVSGTIDETTRHAITKLARIHFPTTARSKERLLKMGEDPKNVFFVGCPTIDALKELDLSIDASVYERNGKGYGDLLDFSNSYVLVLQHPVTTEYAENANMMTETLEALRSLRMPTLLFWPNIDAGADRASKVIREFIDSHELPALSVHKTFSSEDFYRALNNAAVAIGNSSSFIREGSYLGTPAVLVGSRQQGRERAENVIEVPPEREAILAAARSQLAHGKYPESKLFGEGNAAKKIADILATVEIPSQKIFHD